MTHRLVKFCIMVELDAVVKLLTSSWLPNTMDPDTTRLKKKLQNTTASHGTLRGFGVGEWKFKPAWLCWAIG